MVAIHIDGMSQHCPFGRTDVETYTKTWEGFGVSVHQAWSCREAKIFKQHDQ